jgi:hypothetical protein
MINCYVLPDLEGYRPDWTFSFVSEPDLDDELKQVQINQGKTQILTQLYQMQIPTLAAMKIAQFSEEDIEAVRKEQLAGAEFDRLPGEPGKVAGTGDDRIVEQYRGTDGQQGYQGSDGGRFA